MAQRSGQQQQNSHHVNTAHAAADADWILHSPNQLTDSIQHMRAHNCPPSEVFRLTASSMQMQKEMTSKISGWADSARVLSHYI